MGRDRAAARDPNLSIGLLIWEKGASNMEPESVKKAHKIEDSPTDVDLMLDGEFFQADFRLWFRDLDGCF